MSWGNLLLLFGGFVGVLIAVGTLAKSKENTANFFLIVFLLVCAFGIVLKLLDHTGNMPNYPHLSRLNHPIGFLRPPLFFLFVVYTLSPRRISVRSYLHFAPALALSLYFMPYFALSLLFQKRTKPNIWH